MTRKLKVFLCHASEDKPTVRKLYNQLASEPWIEPWLDEEDLLPGQDFDLEIYKATRDADAIIICLSQTSVIKEGYVNKEIRRAYDIALEKPEGVIYVIPLRLDECDPSFEYLKKLHWADYFKSNSHERLVKALRSRANVLNVDTSETDDPPNASKALPAVSYGNSDVDLDLYKFIQIPATDEVPYSFYISKYPVTNEQYNRFYGALEDYYQKPLWINFPKYNENCILTGKWGSEGWDWLEQTTGESGFPLMPRFWRDEDLGISNPNKPIVGIGWYEANAYCNWLKRHWLNLEESYANPNFRIKQIRLPLETEWIFAAGGENPGNRYAWDLPRRATIDKNEIARHANVADNVGYTTPVNAYFRGGSPHGVMDMSGNVWEWQANIQYSILIEDKIEGVGLRGGSWRSNEANALVSARNSSIGLDGDRGLFGEKDIGFRVMILPNDSPPKI